MNIILELKEKNTYIYNFYIEHHPFSVLTLMISAVATCKWDLKNTFNFHAIS